jgi:glycosyltransferase involved in cell wall biosynthesis
MITVVIHTLDDAETLADVLESLVPAAVSGLVREVIIADGGSSDATLDIADASGADIVVVGTSSSQAGFAQAMAVGATKARFPWLLCLPPDVRLEPDWERAAMRVVLSEADTAARFRIVTEEGSRTDRLLAALDLPYFSGGIGADTALLISRAAFHRSGGYRLGGAARLRLAATRLVTIDARAVRSRRRRGAAAHRGANGGHFGVMRWLRMRAGGKSPTQTSVT